jgi:hypothetical protein
MHHRITTSVVLAASACAWATTGAQPAVPGEPSAAAPATSGAQPAGVQLGHRAAAVDLSVVALPMVEIAPDTGAYLAALGRWSLERGTWPVLMDDGTDRAREDIARFVRAFQPERVVRLAPMGEVDEAELEPRASTTMRLVWGAREGQLLETRWTEVNLRPCGVVVANAVDPAWTAAMALALGRGQPMVWVMAPLGAPGGQTEAPVVDDINAQVRTALAKMPWTFEDLGDDIDAITVCMALGGRVVNAPGGKGPLALSDMFGREGDAQWAWGGWIFGSHASAAYTAMCSLFLRVDSAWMFDAYGAKYPEQFACAQALPLFQRVGTPVELIDPRAARLDTWRRETVGGVDAGLIHVNSAGHYNWFQLADTNAWASEVPMLLRPALVSFTHSFSAQYVNGPSSISGRWLEEGAFGYIGAMDEPSLGGFVPPNVLVARLVAGGAWGYAPRLDGSPPWKVQVIGDPLKTVGPKRRIGDLPEKMVDGATDLEQEMRDHAEAGRFAEACAALVMLGRDEDAVRLARSVVASETASDAEKAGVARVGLRPAFRALDAELFVRLYGLLPSDVASRDGERALLWQIVRDELEGGEPTEAMITALMVHTRPESAVDDASAIRGHVARIFGDQAVRSMYQRLIEQARDNSVKQGLMRAMGPG